MHSNEELASDDALEIIIQFSKINKFPISKFWLLKSFAKMYAN